MQKTNFFLISLRNSMLKSIQRQIDFKSNVQKKLKLSLHDEDHLLMRTHDRKAKSHLNLFRKFVSNNIYKSL